jgi:hypothetical protein
MKPAATCSRFPLLPGREGNDLPLRNERNDKEIW